MAEGDSDHDKLIRVEEGVGYIIKKIDSICDQQKDRDDRYDERFKCVEGRVTTVEHNQSRVAGGIGVLAAGVAVVTSFLMSLFKS